MDSKVTRFIFWIAFMSFLCASIPHVAWIFFQFEQGTNDQVISLWSFQFNIWQGLSYLIALSIDALIMWLSFQLSIGKSKIDSGLTWTFIIILSALSWYCNWLYSIAHSPASHIDIWSLPLFGGLTTVGTFTPLLVSAFPVFSIGYTFMLSRLSKASMTPEELENHLKAKKRIADIREQYGTSESRVTSFLKRGIRDIADIGIVAKDAISQVRQGQGIPVLEAESLSIQPPMTPVLSAESTRFLETVTPVQTEIYQQSDISFSDDTAEILAEDTSSNENVFQEDFNELPNSSTRRRYVHIEEAVTILEYDLQYVKTLRTRGILKTQSRNHDMISVASINTVISKKQKATIKHPKAVNTPTDRDTGEMEIQPSLLTSNLVDTSEEISEYEQSLVVSH